MFKQFLCLVFQLLRVLLEGPSVVTLVPGTGAELQAQEQYSVEAKIAEA